MNQLGKRYQCQHCQAEVLCSRPGDGEIRCCSEPMQVKAAKPLPSSD